ncbi:MAG TPA: NAD(P)/FAD-dependent oxidoreductase [Polyangiaceae bacterium]|nr:NAD(P)/FAD-dependent oxidoreductase [Polyangiaceae bacterium]
MSKTQYDVIVIGGGPSGATVAARLRQAGRSVVLFERERFPRFHIGESLLPCSMPLFEELGVAPALARANFLPKHAAEFVTADGKISRRYAFADGLVPGPASAYEVDRSEFDKVLLDHAAEQGATVEQETQVVKFDCDRQRGVSATVRGPDGDREVSAELLIDATGQNSLLAGRLGLREMDPGLKNFTVFSHFDGAVRHSGVREGDITIVLVPEGWWWLIPLRGNRTSVGLVAPSRMLKGRKPDEAYLLERIAATPYLAERLAAAERVAPVRSVSDYSYVSRRLVGDRWLMVGDAGAFIDPVFSTGVYLGMCSAFRAADSVTRAFERRDFSAAMFRDYERFVRRIVKRYRAFVKGFYQPEFAEVLMQPSDWLKLRAAITSLLAGYGVDRFEVNWRVLVFRAIARANRGLALTPRLSGRRETFAQ